MQLFTESFRGACDTQIKCTIVLQPLLSQCKLMGKTYFGVHVCHMTIAVNTQLDHCVKVVSLPCALSGGIVSTICSSNVLLKRREEYLKSIHVTKKNSFVNVKKFMQPVC